MCEVGRGQLLMSSSVMPYTSLKQGFSLACQVSYTDWPMNPGSPCLGSQHWNYKHVPLYLAFFLWVLGIKFRPSCLWYKHFLDFTVFAALVCDGHMWSIFWIFTQGRLQGASGFNLLRTCYVFSCHDIFCIPISDVGGLQFLHILLNTGCSSGCPRTHHVAYTGLVLVSDPLPWSQSIFLHLLQRFWWVWSGVLYIFLMINDIKYHFKCLLLLHIFFGEMCISPLAI